MRSSNGFNKKQKEEIREIVKSEIREALRKNAKPDINAKDETIKAIYSVLNEKDDELIKNLIEIEEKISKKETEKSFFAANMKDLLRGICILAGAILVMFFIAMIYWCIASGNIQKNIIYVVALFSVFFYLLLFFSHFISL